MLKLMSSATFNPAKNLRHTIFWPLMSYYRRAPSKDYDVAKCNIIQNKMNFLLTISTVFFLNYFKKLYSQVSLSLSKDSRGLYSQFLLKMRFYQLKYGIHKEIVLQFNVHVVLLLISPFFFDTAAYAIFLWIIQNCFFSISSLRIK